MPDRAGRRHTLGAVALVLCVACAAQPARGPSEPTRAIPQLTLAAGHRGLVSTCAEAPRHAWLATGGCDGTTRLWRRSQAGELATLRGHGGAVEALTFNHDEALLATAGSDGFVNVWNLERGELVARTAIARGILQPMARACIWQPGQTAPIGWKLVFDRADRLWLLDAAHAASSWQGPEWSLLGHARSGRFEFGTPAPSSAAPGPPELSTSERVACFLDEVERERYRSLLSPWDRALVSSKGAFVVVAGAVTGDPLPQRLHWFPLQGRGTYETTAVSADRLENVIDSNVGPVALLRDESTDDDEMTWRLFALREPQRDWSLKSRAGAQTLAPLDAQRVVFVRPDGTLGVQTFRAATSTAIGAARDATCVTASADGRRIAWGEAGGDVVIWDAAAGRIVARLDKASAPAVELAFAGNATWLALRLADARVELWNLRDRKARVLEPGVVWQPALARAPAPSPRRPPFASTFASAADRLLVRHGGAMSYVELTGSRWVDQSWISAVPEASRTALADSGNVLIHDAAGGDVLATDIARGAKQLLAWSPVGEVRELAGLAAARAALVLGSSGLVLVRVDRPALLYLDVVARHSGEVTAEFHPLAFSTTDGRFAGSPAALAHLLQRSTRPLGTSPSPPVAAPRTSLAGLIADFLRSPPVD